MTYIFGMHDVCVFADNRLILINDHESLNSIITFFVSILYGGIATLSGIIIFIIGMIFLFKCI